MHSLFRRARKPIVFAVVAAMAVAVYFVLRDVVSLSLLAEREANLRRYATEHPVLVIAGTFLLYVAATSFSFPVASLLTMTIGWFFGKAFGEVQGLLIAVVVVSFGSTAGSMFSFLLSRYLFREALERRFGARLKEFNDELLRTGAYYLFTLRLIPIVPYFIVNLVMGLTPLPARTFWWVGQLGMLPGTCLYVFAGSRVPNLQELAERGPGVILTPGLIAAFVLLGVFPLAARKTLTWWKARLERQ
jgi:uncharacterized membrane protein YdjX (TVP38/TMEM64 family)